MRLLGPRRWRALAGAGLLALLPGAALAGETWLVPLHEDAAAHELVRFDLSTGSSFPRADRAVAADRIEHARIRVGSRQTRLSGRSQRKNALRLAATVDRAGVAAAWVVLRERTVRRGPGELSEYLARIGEADGEWKTVADSPPEAWREIEQQSFETFVRVGSPGAADRSWADPVGMPLEIVPERDPTLLTAGDVLPVRVFFERGALGNIAVCALAAGGGKSRIVRTGPDGRVRIVLDSPGAWLLTATRLEAGSAPGAPAKSAAVSLYLVVGKAPAVSPPPASGPGPGPGPANLIPDQPFRGQSPASAKPWEEILRLKQAGESNEALLARVRQGDVLYSLTTADIQKLRDAGVSREVIEAMLRSGRGPTPTPR
jgi:uncharacterized GH25 family protein